MPWGFSRGFAGGSAAKGFGTGYGRGLGICKLAFLNSPSYSNYLKDTLELEKKVLEQKLEIIEKILRVKNRKGF